MKRKIKNRKEPKDFTFIIVKLLANNPLKKYTYKQIATQLDVEDSFGKNLIIWT